MLKIRKEQLVQLLKILFPILLLVIATIEIGKAVNGIDGSLLRHEVSQLQPWKVILIFVFALCTILPMLFYDVILIKLLGIQMKAKKLVKHSFIVNTFSNLIGFGGLVGLMLRSYFYSNYKEEKKGVLKTITSVTLFYLTGISLLSWIVLIGFRNFPLLVDKTWLFLIVGAVSIYLPMFILYSVIRLKKENSSSIKIKVASSLIATSTIEWISVFLLIWLLTYFLHIPIGLTDLIPVFLIAACVGIASMIPGGIGSFDLIFLWGTQSLGIADEKVLVLLVLYRLSYFVIPFLLAAFLFVKDYWEKWNRSWNNIPNTVFEQISHTLLTFAVFISGIILLLSASVPGVLSRLKIAQDFLSLPIMNVSHQLTVIAGVLLLGLCRGIEYQVKRTYNIVVIVLALAAVFSLLKGFDFEEAIFVGIVAILLKVSKKRFYRESYVRTWGKISFDMAVIFTITAMYVIIGYVNLPASNLRVSDKILPYILTDYLDLFYSAIIGLLIAGIILLFGYFGRKSKQIEKISPIHYEDEIKEHLGKYGGTELSHLIFTNDKYIFWNEEKTVLFSYQTYADKIVVLGNPVGKKDDFSSAIEKLLETADLYGYTPVYYEVSREFIPYLHEYGYGFFKLGEEAFVNLERFSFSGKKMKNARAIKNKFERELYRVELLTPPFQADLMQQLRIVSDEWLHGRKEKGFSLGFFDEKYLNTSEIAVMKGEEGIIGFASLMPMYDNHKVISVDLMRFKPGSPSGTMDYIFLSLFEWASESGYERFNIGMAPLSNVGLSKYSFLPEKLAAQLFLHGQFFYHFKGLRNFKEKYANNWEPKYLAYRKRSSLPITMAQLTLMIGKGRESDNKPS
ncbi:bifunctional lysylphosphatidylglycerol flippase/synthetase MprF [Sporosarcina sp. G11-34]|uniref:bifunctional lysylphosphatidylglycerol flippase/synthetase MprF n=1 Tax=Sporosarcina sp. G11-34 TaxID=2849605 RepID=UPI0022A9837E|nr:bifunctional lysylphosphatidylglycerol flippase/synthetase MprF [Sporosarcina sp. G11-34]MCZ2258118.1 bifunctional lysylphosphatidylglycerol flippase/synthetase MprF [Sporosarcina sp. G11-34]